MSLYDRFTTRVTATHSGTLKFNKKEYKATGRVVQVRMATVQSCMPHTVTDYCAEIVQTVCEIASPQNIHVT